MNLFYSANIIDQNIVLKDQEAVHCAKVLRHAVGDQIYVLDGCGNLFHTRITQLKKEAVYLDILLKKTANKGVAHLPHIGIAIIKSAARLEWFVEKATEIGVRRISPLICSRSEKRRIKKDRLEKITISAMKQSKHWFKPVISSPMGLGEFIDGAEDPGRYIAHFSDSNPTIHDLAPLTRPCTVLIGPEGDFSHDEMEKATKMDFLPINLSDYRLRTETAGIVACTLFNSLYS